MSGKSYLGGRREIILDIKALFSEYFLAIFTADGKSLNVSFNNGQKFRITVSEISKSAPQNTQEN